MANLNSLAKLIVMFAIFSIFMKNQIAGGVIFLLYILYKYLKRKKSQQSLMAEEYRKTNAILASISQTLRNQTEAMTHVLAQLRINPHKDLSQKVPHEIVATRERAEYVDFENRN